MVARADSEAATLITSTIDDRDHPFLLRTANAALQPLNDLMAAAEKAGKCGTALQTIETEWLAQARLQSFDDAVFDQIRRAHSGQEALATRYLTASKGRSNLQARTIAREPQGVDVYWNWDSPRTRESGTKCAVNRANSLALPSRPLRTCCRWKRPSGLCAGERVC